MQQTTTSLESLPADAWQHFKLRRRDWAAVALTSKRLRDVAYAVAGGSLRLASHRDASQFFGSANPAWRGPLTDLFLRVVPHGELSFCAAVRGPYVFEKLNALDVCSVSLRPGFWQAVFECCQRLRVLRVRQQPPEHREYYKTLISYLRSTADLLKYGVPRLERLRLASTTWFPDEFPDEFPGAAQAPQAIPSEFARDVEAAVRFLRDAVPVSSSTLICLENYSGTAVLGVDAPLQTLHAVHGDPASVMGPVTLETLEVARWRPSWSALDFSRLAPFRNLHTAELRVDARNLVDTNRAIATLRHLPRSLRKLDLEVDLWFALTSVDGLAASEVHWGTPLEDHDRLETLTVDVTFVPATARQVLQDWLGVGSGVKFVMLRFQVDHAEEYSREIEENYHDIDEEDDWMISMREAQHEAATIPLHGGWLSDWLWRHPNAIACVVNASPTFQCAHPRAELK